MKAKISAQVKLGLLLLVTLCSFTLRLASAQTDQTPNIPAGYTLIDGDMLMPESFVNSLRQSLRMAPHAPQATYSTNFWPNGIVPFEFDANCGPGSMTCVTAANQTAMRAAMTVLQNVANLNFQQCPNNSCSGNFVHIQNSTANNSMVGMVGGQQVINIFNWNIQFIMVHELMHCLGFVHEHQRLDRGLYVQINNNNISATACGGGPCLGNFTIVSPASTYGYYDFDSVMHYGQCAFSTNPNCPAASPAFPDGGITISVQPPFNTQWQNAIGQTNHLSDLDRATVSFIYPFANWRFLDCTYNGSNGTSNGTFLRPYTSFATAFANTPVPGTLWILNTCHFPATGTYSNDELVPIRIRVAPGVIATLGN